uniref:cholesterol 7-desaturase n=1 Tax=Chrysemys picta bellii TaxID=8478 RepID=A0A8C3I3Y2_CHRPI|nr:cholesterol 7-desaturase nvd-like [Chrysemys picta bellii]
MELWPSRSLALLLLCAAGALLLLPAGEPGSWGRALPPLLLLLAGGAALLRLCARPLALRRAPERVGYLPERGCSRRQAARRARRSRRAGDLPPLYPNGWFRLLDSHGLPRGGVRSLAALGEQVAVFRALDGQVYVVDAYCPHLGANLAAGGRVVGNCIECPFHGWQFRGEDGKCTTIPYAEKVPDFAKIKTWPSCEVNGMILVWYHCDGVDPVWTVPEQEEITSKEWVYRGHTEHFVNAHIQEIPENAADFAHLSFLHEPVFMSGVDLRFTHSKLWESMKHCWKGEWQPEPEPNKHCSLLMVKHSLTVFGKHFSWMDFAVRARQVGPGLVYLTFEHAFLGRGIILQSVTPVEPLLQHVVHRIYYQRNMPAVIPKFILKVECVQFERDIMIWNNKQYLSKPLLVKEDSAIQRHRRWFAQFYSENSTRFTFQKGGVDW